MTEFLGEKFICGVCGEHRGILDLTDKKVYIGLYGTEWQVCKECEGKVQDGRERIRE